MFKISFIIFLLFIGSNNVIAESMPIVKDGDLILSKSEVEWVLGNIPKKEIRFANNKNAVIYDFLNEELKIKKMVVAFDTLLLEIDNSERLKMKRAIDQFKAKVLSDYYDYNLKIPNMEALAKEKYLARKDDIAKIAEKRSSSHILIKCDYKCMGDAVIEKKKKAQDVLDKIRQGASFEEMVMLYSEDPKSKMNKGLLSRMVSKDDKKYAKKYLEGLFAIEKIGNISEVVRSQFGFHILRLENIEKSSYRTFDVVKSKLIKELESRYKALSIIDYKSNFSTTKDIKYNDKILNQMIDELITIPEN